MLTLTQVQEIVDLGNVIGEGSTRTVYWSPRYRDYVVKMSRRENDISANTSEYYVYAQYAENPYSRVRLPKTTLVGEYIVQERVRGEFPPDCIYFPEDESSLFCSCGLLECWAVIGAEVTEDVYQDNFRFVDGELWCLDFADARCR